MKFSNLIIFILIIFNKTGNVLSNESIFHVNNIELIRKTNVSNDELASKAIEEGFLALINKILLKEDVEKLSKLNSSQIKELVSYYQITNQDTTETEDEKISFNIFFDKEKFHKLFYLKSISYSEINDKEIYFLPILKKGNQIYIYNNNFYYENWVKLNKESLIEFILPLENIEIFQMINLKKNNLLSLDLQDLFQEYSRKNLAIVLIDETNKKTKKIYLKIRILNKNLSKNLKIDFNSKENNNYNQYLISKISNVITDMVKSQNLIDVRTPSFLNTKTKNTKINNLVELNDRFKKIDLVDSLYIQELSKDYIRIKIKYFGKLNKIINKLNDQNISLKLINEEWRLEINK